MQAERLSEFYEVCRSIDIGRGERFIKIEQVPFAYMFLHSLHGTNYKFQLPVLSTWIIKFILLQPPASFLTAMEEYVKDAPRASTVRKDQVWKLPLLLIFYL